MNKPDHYDVFISYRRDGGDMTALYLYEQLTRAGYRVAYDFETLLNGRWDDRILEAVRGCRDLVLVLSPGALDRCVEWEMKNRNSADADKNDWMRLEVACALKHGKNVIPVMLRDFVFPPEDTLPSDIRALRFQNGMSASAEHHRDVFSRLRRMLTSRPSFFHRPLAPVAGIVALGIVAAALAVVVPKCRRAEPAYPSTREEVQQVNEVAGAIAMQSAAYQEAVAARKTLIMETVAAIDDRSSLEPALSLFRRQMERALEKLANAKPSEASFRALAPTPIPVDVYRALFDNVEIELTDALRTLPGNMVFYAGENNAMALKDRRKCLALAMKRVKLDSQFYALGVIELFHSVSPSALADFRRLATTLTDVPRLSQAWPSDMEQLNIEQSAVIEQLNDVLVQTSAVVGKRNMEVSSGRAAPEYN